MSIDSILPIDLINRHGWSASANMDFWRNSDCIDHFVGIRWKEKCPVCEKVIKVDEVVTPLVSQI